MALCTTCQTKTTINSPGSCSKCSAPTTHFAYRLCDSCSQQLQECEWCQIPLNGGPNSSIVARGATPYYVTLRMPDDGKKTKNLNIGEQVHIVLEEDQYTWREWDVKTFNRGRFKLISRGQFVPDPSDPQYGTRTFVFEVIGSGSADIEFHEVTRTWSWGWGDGSGGGQPVQGGKTWKHDFEVK
jgi:predicted secreted protein